MKANKKEQQKLIDRTENLMKDMEFRVVCADDTDCSDVNNALYAVEHSFPAQLYDIFAAKSDFTVYDQTVSSACKFTCEKGFARLGEEKPDHTVYFIFRDPLTDIPEKAGCDTVFIIEKDSDTDGRFVSCLEANPEMMKLVTEENLNIAHKAAFANGDIIRKRPQLCACFDCGAVYPSSEIDDWITERDGSQTAFCPYCCDDAVIGEASGYPMEEWFFGRMHERFFGRMIAFNWKGNVRQNVPLITIHKDGSITQEDDCREHWIYNIEEDD